MKELRLVASFLIVVLGVLTLSGNLTTLPSLLAFLEKHLAEAGIITIIGMFLMYK